MKVVPKNNNGPDSITKTYDLLKWAIPHLKKFPRDQRFLLGDRIEDHLLDILELLLSANYSKEKLGFLNINRVAWPDPKRTTLSTLPFPSRTTI